MQRCCAPECHMDTKCQQLGCTVARSAKCQILSQSKEIQQSLKHFAEMFIILSEVLVPCP